MFMLLILQWFIMKLINCSSCCIPATLTLINTRTGNTHTASVISEECTSKIEYTLRLTEALNGVHINITITQVIIYAIAINKQIKGVIQSVKSHLIARSILFSVTKTNFKMMSNLLRKLSLILCIPRGRRRLNLKYISIVICCPKLKVGKTSCTL